MIHGHKKSHKKKSELEQKQQTQLSEKINKKLSQFFLIRNEQIAEHKIQTLFQFTSILMELCPDIPTIYNYRRELINKILQKQAKENKQKIINNEIKLNNKIIQGDPKSYTLWSYRQWLVIKLYQINPIIIDKERQLCSLLLNKDQKNFHVWNYRNWINTIQMNVDGELQFTKTKINTNPFNFSAYHFRSKYLLWKYKHQISNLPIEQQQQIIVYGMPKQVFDAELQTVKTAIFLNPKEQAPWNYYNWLLKGLAPVLLLDIRPLTQEAQNDKYLSYEVVFSHGVQNFKEIVHIQGDKQFQLFSQSTPSHKWEIRTKQPISSKQIQIKPPSPQTFSKSTINSKIIDISKQQQIEIINKIYENEQKFVKQVVESQQNICHFGYLELLQIYKLFIYLGTTKDKWIQISTNAISVFQGLEKQNKNKKYFEKVKLEWERLYAAENLSQIQNRLITWK